MGSAQAPFRVATLAVFLGLTLIPLVRPGMFMDGLLYLTVAHNLAHGFGSFWQPRFSQEGLLQQPTFHEHPPLAFGMEALWFRTFGDAFWVEGAYALAMAVLTAWLLILLWRMVWGPEKPERDLWWLPVLFWIITPAVHWSVQNHMQENTMAVFTVAAVLCTVRGMRADGYAWGHFAAVGMLSCTAALVKGPPGLFPIGAPLLWGLFASRPDLRKGMLGTVVASACLVLCFVFLFSWPEARSSLMQYAEGRLLHRIDQDPTVDYRWRTVQHLFLAMLGPLLLTLIAVLSARRSGQQGPMVAGKKATALIAVGLSGVLPLMLTMVQKSFYMVAALPMIAVGLAVWAAPQVVRWTERPRTAALRGVMNAFAVASLAGVVLAAGLFFGTPSRDAELLNDTALIGEVVPAHALVSAEQPVLDQWNFQSYLMRYHFISLTGKPDQPFAVTVEGSPGPAGYERLPLATERIHLWQRARTSAHQAPMK